MIGVSQIQVKPAQMKDLLPPGVPFALTQSPDRPTRKALATLDHLIVVSPARVPESIWRLAPELRALRALARRRADEATQHVLRSRGPAPRGMGVTLGRLPGRPAELPAAHQLLGWAGRLAADALGDDPRTVGVLMAGLGPAEAQRVAQAIILALAARAWRGPQFRSTSKPAGRLRSVRLLGLGQRLELDRTLAEAEAANLVRWFTALPPNRLHVQGYRDVIAALASEAGWQHRFLDEKALGRLGAGAFLAVAQGSEDRDAGIVHLRYRPRGTRSKRPIALVGKGIIFDTGGTNLKPHSAMLDMHHDMSGSAVALGVLRALTQLRVPVAVDCWLAITENRLSASAYKPRDIVRAANGTTIEVIHTDAEGRMALADALALAGRENPALVLDFATLTGACVSAVTERYSGVFTNRPDLNELLIRAGRSAGERVWPFPMDEDFDDDLKSAVADVLQCAVDARGDHILAARFLQRFVPKDAAWIHVDLAAASRKQGLAQMPGGVTGFGARFALALLLDHAAALEEVTGPLGLPGREE